MSGQKIAMLGWGRSVHTRKWVESIAARGYRVKLIGLTGQPIENVQSVLFERKGRRSYILRAPAAVREVRAFKPDLLHIHYAAGFGLWGLLCRVRPTIVSVWGADIIDFPSGPVTRKLMRVILGKATAISATSNMLKERANSLLPGANNKTIVIPFGVSVPESFTPEPSPQPIRICFLKALAPKYGPDILIRAVAKVKAECPGIKLSLAGSGPMEQELRRLVCDLELEEQVDFCGYVDHDIIYDFLSRHQFMVMPSTMESESFGVAVLEAAACGRPTIASNVGGVPEVIIHGETGLLVKPNDVEALSDAIIELARSADRRRIMGENAFNFVRENYTWNKSVDMMTSLYERVIDEARAHTAV